jgi:hypothetical protein
MYMKDEAGLGLAVHWLQQALITAYEDNCPPQIHKDWEEISEMDSETGVSQKRGQTALQ